MTNYEIHKIHIITNQLGNMQFADCEAHDLLAHYDYIIITTTLFTEATHKSILPCGPSEWTFHDNELYALALTGAQQSAYIYIIYGLIY